MQKLSSIHRLGKTFERVQGFHGWGRKFENHEILLKSRLSCPELKIQNRFADAKLRLRGMPEMTRRDGLPVGNNILYGPGHVRWPTMWNYVYFLARKINPFDQFRTIKFVRNIFPNSFGIILCCVQKLSSIHRPRKVRTSSRFPWLRSKI